MPAGTRCLRALLDVVAMGVRGSSEPDPRLVAALDESRIGGGQDGAAKLGCLEICGATCEAVLRRHAGRTQLAVTNQTNFQLCTEE